MTGITVVKIGGNEVDDGAWLERLAAAVAFRGGPAVLVHGGGKEISSLQRTLGAEPEWRDGLRVTTPEAMRAAAMVLSGVINKRIAAALVSAGVDAVGLSGEDGGLLAAEPLQGGALGRTGAISRVRTSLLRLLLEAGITPVISPVSRGPDGCALNVNADDAAEAVATALHADELLFVSNVAGVLVGTGVIPSVESGEIDRLTAEEAVHGGMVPKLRAAARAASSVAAVRIGSLEVLASGQSGTRVRAAVPALNG